MQFKLTDIQGTLHKRAFDSLIVQLRLYQQVASLGCNSNLHEKFFT